MRDRETMTSATSPAGGATAKPPISATTQTLITGPPHMVTTLPSLSATRSRSGSGSGSRSGLDSDSDSGQASVLE
jgi:hypothetical protein